MRYAIEWLRFGVIVRQYVPNFTNMNRRQSARSLARVFAARLPLPRNTWGAEVGWIVRLYDRRQNLVLESWESAENAKGKRYAKLISGEG